MSAEKTRGVSLPHEDLVEDDEDERNESHEHRVEVGDALRHDVGREPVEQAADERRRSPRRPVPDEAIAADAAGEEGERGQEVDAGHRPPDGRDGTGDHGQQRDGDVGGVVDAKGNVDPVAEERVHAVGERERGPRDVPGVELRILARLQRVASHRPSRRSSWPGRPGSRTCRWPPRSGPTPARAGGGCGRRAAWPANAVVGGPPSRGPSWASELAAVPGPNRARGCLVATVLVRHDRWKSIWASPPGGATSEAGPAPG